MSAAIFAGTHMYVVYGVGAFNEVSIVAMLKSWFRWWFLWRCRNILVQVSCLHEFLEGSLVGILDLGGSILTGIGIGVPAIFPQHGN